jgi:hypothetical protein
MERDGDTSRPPEGAESTRVAFSRSGWSAAYVRALSAVRWFVRSDETRTVRRILLVSAVVQLALAPLTSWSGDTPSFILSALAFLYRGNPYIVNLYFNPPLAIYLQAPFFALVTSFVAPQSLVRIVPAFVPYAAAVGLPASIPVPVALVALKLPLIAACLASGAGIYYLGGKLGFGPGLRAVSTAAWSLNPLVLWATAVHGEVDALAAFFVVLFLICLQRRAPLLAGVALGLGFFSKAYPIFVVPVGLAYFLVVTSSSGARNRLTQCGLYFVGLGISALPFLPLYSVLTRYYLGLTSGGLYGGFSPLAVFNPGEVSPGSSFAGLLTSANASIAHDALFAALVLTVVLAPLLLIRRNGTSVGPELRPLLASAVAATLWCATASVLSLGAPQSENLLGIVAPLVVISPQLRRVGWISLGLLSGAGFALYMTLASPVAYFTPLGAILGTSSLQQLGSMMIAFQHDTPISLPTLWLTWGLLGAAVLVAIWVACFARSMRAIATALRGPKTEKRGHV